MKVHLLRSNELDAETDGRKVSTWDFFFDQCGRYRLMQYLIDQGFREYLQFCDDFRPFGKKDFLSGHTLEYVNDFFEGGRLSVTNGLPWSRELVDSFGY